SERGAVRRAPSRRSDNNGFFAGFAFDGDDRIVKGVTNARERQSLLARDVVLTAVAALPVLDDLQRELLQSLYGRGHEKRVDPVGAPRAGNVVNIHVSHRSGDDL